MGKKSLIVVREMHRGIARALKVCLEDAGYEVYLVSVQGSPMDSGVKPELAFTFWGTTPGRKEHPLYGLSSRAFCSSCISEGIPFVILTRWPRAVPEEFATRASRVLEKGLDLNEPLLEAVRELL